MAKSAASTESLDVALVVFGLDDAGKAHASRFAAADAELAAKAAGLMGMRSLPVATDEHRAAAVPLPQGRVFASGKAFVPFVKRAAYEHLKALAGPAADEAGETRVPPADEAAAVPAIAMTAVQDEGVSETGEQAAEGAEPTEGAADGAEPIEAVASAGAAESAEAAGDDQERALPTEWQAIEVGDLVLAPETDRLSWWPALVLKDKGNRRWVLKWRDFEEPKSFVRQHSELGLLNPETTLR